MKTMVLTLLGLCLVTSSGLYAQTNLEYRQDLIERKDEFLNRCECDCHLREDELQDISNSQRVFFLDQDHNILVLSVHTGREDLENYVSVLN